MLTDVIPCIANPEQKKRAADNASTWLSFWASKRRVIADLHVREMMGQFVADLMKQLMPSSPIISHLFSGIHFQSHSCCVHLPLIVKASPEDFGVTSFEQFDQMFVLLIDTGVGIRSSVRLRKSRQFYMMLVFILGFLF